MKTSWLKRILFIVLIITVFSFIFWQASRISRLEIDDKDDYTAYKSSANKVFLFIGDGMGENHLKVTEAYFEQPLFMSSIANNGYVTTFSNNLSGPTDSAAAATAMATGIKVDNGEIAYHNDAPLSLITETIKALGMGVGIVTTDYLYGATPAGFSAHAPNRDDTSTIIASQINSDIDLFLGRGVDAYAEYADMIKEQHYDYCLKYSELNVNAARVFATFTKISKYTSTDDAPTLSELVDFAIDYFDTNFPQGYFLMIEGAHIDKRSHDNNIISMMEYLDEFDNAIEYANQKMQSHEQYTILITADHETGGLVYNGEGRDAINNSLFTTTSHTSVDVKYYLISPTPLLLPAKIDNTDIYQICLDLLE